MADRGDTHYPTLTLNRWFAISSIVFLITVVWMVIDDWNAEWKVDQREFRALDLRKAEEAKTALEQAGVLDKKAELEAKVAEAKSLADQHKSDLEALRREILDKKEVRYKKEQALKSLKGQYAMARYRFDELVYKKVAESEIASTQKSLEAMDSELQAADLAFAQASAEVDAAQAKYDAIEKAVSDAEKALNVGTTDLARVEKKIDQLDPTDSAVRLANFVRDFPGLDFVGPNLKIQKYVLPNLTFELNFTKKRRIDMCTTCHMAVDRAGFEKDENPFATHPRLDLFVSSKSPHPAKDVGCTICHRGAGEGLSFQTADHRPRDEEEAHAWHEEHDWHKQHHWDYPMLQSQHIEASCVQCHKTSMELIAEEAPDLTKGYQLFERYGCYACHKVDWFPTKRRPGPSLKNLAAKVTPTFVDAWVSAPRSFRPTTWMPQIFHLENFKPDEVIVPNPDYGRDTQPILGQTWNDTAVAAVVAFLFANHPKQELPAIPVESPDKARGRDLFQNVGCAACHNTGPYPGETLTVSNLSDEPGRYNDKGPNLRGVAAKVDKTWLYNWIKDPEKWWPETRMPNLRLSDQDAADITAYLTEDPDNIFRDVPTTWKEKTSPVDLRTLQEQARWFFQKMGRTELERRMAGNDPENRWNDTQALLVAVGQEWVKNQGCFSCHEIRGLENAMPIGTELSNWGSKTVDKLDFGIAYRKDLAGLPELDHEYREQFLERKLQHPRFFDLEKVKNPKEKLRMPWFDFTDEQVQSLMTFVLGLVDDEVQLAKMVPTPEKAGMDRGLRALRQKNCVGCHVVDAGRMSFEDEHGTLVTVDCELLPLPEEKMPPRMTDLEHLKATLAKWAEDSGEDVPEEVGIRLLAANGDAGGPGENVFVPLEKIRGVFAPHGGDFVRLVTNYYLNGMWVANPDYDPSDKESYPDMPWTIKYDEENQLDLLEDVDGKYRSYANEEYDKIRWTFAPPVLINEGHKLQPKWFYSFLEDPVSLRKQIRVRMPSFHFDSGEAESLADYFLAKAREEWHVRYSHAMRLALGRKLRPGLEDASTNSWPPEFAHQWPTTMHMTSPGPGMTLEAVASASGIGLTSLQGIEQGNAIATAANFDKLFAWGTQQGFVMVGPPSNSYEAIERRQASYEPKVDLGFAIGKQAVNCLQCHFLNGAPPDQKDVPLAWAPDLVHTRDRLREDYVWEWLWSPKLVYPGTSMPDNFAADHPQYQAIAPNTSNADQIRAVMDWLYNSEKTPTTSN
jgi:cytochrome c2